VSWAPLLPELGDCVASWSSDLGDDGSVDETRVETYDGSGWLVNATYHLVFTELSYDYVYDAAGHVTEFRLDAGLDGTVDVLELYTYDASGALIAAYGESAFSAFRATYTNGPCGPVTRTADDDDDGTLDLLETTVWSVTRVETETDDNLDGTTDYTQRFDYDAVLGELEHYEYEGDASFAGPEIVRDHTYDADGRTDVITTNRRSDQTTETITHAYDADGRLIERLIEDTWLPTARETAVWTCP
jgi:hypothetical protein